MIFPREKQERAAELEGLKALLAQTPDDPLAKPLMQSRVKELEAELSDMDKDQPAHPETEFLFAGRSVIGSVGIDAKLASRVLDTFQDMLINQHAASRHGSVGSRGRRFGESESRLYLSALPRGSFGLLLSQPQVEDFITATHIAEAMEQITELIRAAAEGDNAFTTAVSSFHSRVLIPLENFLEALDKHEVSVKVRTGSKEISLQRNQVATAYRRVAAAKTKTEELTFMGKFHGILLDSWKFDFLLDTGVIVSGSVSENVTEDEARAMSLLFDKPAEATFLVTRIVTTSGEGQPSYELLALKQRAES